MFTVCEKGLPGYYCQVCALAEINTQGIRSSQAVVAHAFNPALGRQRKVDLSSRPA